MEERIYNGNIDPQGLANHIVDVFNQGRDIVAQQTGQGDQIFVQVGRLSIWSGSFRGALGVSIARRADGLHVVAGQSTWLDLKEPAVSGSLIGGLFFHPLLLFPLVHGLRNFALSQNLWRVIDDYCTQAGATASSSTSTNTVYCPRCGAVNPGDTQQCYLCDGPLVGARPGPPLTPDLQPTLTAVICPRCDATVYAGKFCSNCGSELPAHVS
jgi:ribosomal protein L40E